MLESRVRYERYVVEGSGQLRIMPKDVRSAHVLFQDSTEPHSIVLIPDINTYPTLQYLLHHTTLVTDSVTIKNIYQHLKMEKFFPSPLAYRIYTLSGEDELGVIPRGTVKAVVNFSERKPTLVSLVSLSVGKNPIQVTTESDPQKAQTILNILECMRK
ncbi:MAG: hypothetical protein V2A62_03675 [Candidatus Woesearchaeota archaeon]